MKMASYARSVQKRGSFLGNCWREWRTDSRVAFLGPTGGQYARHAGRKLRLSMQHACMVRAESRLHAPLALAGPRASHQRGLSRRRLRRVLAAATVAAPADQKPKAGCDLC